MEHGHEDYDDNYDETDMFAALEDIGDDLIGDYLERDLIDGQATEGLRRGDRTVAAVLAGCVDEPVGMDWSMRILRNFPDTDIFELAIEVFEISRYIQDVDQNNKLVAASSILSHISNIGACSVGAGDSRTVFAEIIDDGHLDAEVKVWLIGVLKACITDECLPDLNDPDEMTKLLSELESGKEQYDHLHRLRAHAAALIRQYEDRLIEKYFIHPDDPAWIQLRSTARLLVTIRRSADIGYLLIDKDKDALQSLHIPEEDYYIFVNQVYSSMECE